MLRVLCSDSVLAESGETIAVGDRVSRDAVRVDAAHDGIELDTIEWRFDDDALAGGTGGATITGVVRSISAVYVEMTQLGDCTWTAAHGTAHRESLKSTADTRRPEEQIDWGELSQPDDSGAAFQLGYPSIAEGDERLADWEITLDDETITPG